MTKLLSFLSDHPMVKTCILSDHPMVKTFPKPLLFRNSFWKQNQHHSTATFPTIHDRGHGYSNRFTLCRGCTLYPHHPGTLPWSSPIVGQVTDQDSPDAHSNISAYPMSVNPLKTGTSGIEDQPERFFHFLSVRFQWGAHSNAWRPADPSFLLQVDVPHGPLLEKAHPPGIPNPL